MAIVFEHTLPDGTYDNEGHPLHGKTKAIIYAMGMLYGTPEVNEQQFDNVDDYASFIIANIGIAKNKYAEILNETAEQHIRNGLRQFLRKINKVETDVELTTIEE